MIDRHHYSVTTSTPEPTEEWFHLFEEADQRFRQAVEAAAAEGLEVTEESYWRRTLEADDRAVRVSLDDRGLMECGAYCGAG